ncbi:MAG: hypothetical protein ACLFQV_07450 [Vulcanimicrobiota bacterium]
MKKWILVLIIFLIMSMSSVFAQEVIFSSNDFKELAPDFEVSLNKILPDGNIVFVAESKKGRNMQMLLVNPGAKKVICRIEVPVKVPSYIATNKQGTRSVVYSVYSGGFYLVDFGLKEVRQIFKRRAGEPGYALYSHQVSRLSYSDGFLLAWGYKYDAQNRFNGKYVFKIDPDRKGMNAFTPIFETEFLGKLAKRYYPKAQNVAHIEFNRKFMVFSAVNEKGAGGIVSYDFETKKDYKLKSFDSMVGMDIAMEKPIIAYAIQSQNDTEKFGTLFVMNLQKQEARQLDSGKLFNPVFNGDGTRLAVGKVELDENNMLQKQMVIVDMETNKVKTIKLKREFNYYDWKFINNGNSLMIFSDSQLLMLNI